MDIQYQSLAYDIKHRKFEDYWEIQLEYAINNTQERKTT